MVYLSWSLLSSFLLLEPGGVIVVGVVEVEVVVSMRGRAQSTMEARQVLRCLVPSHFHNTLMIPSIRSGTVDYSASVSNLMSIFFSPKRNREARSCLFLHYVVVVPTWRAKFEIVCEGYG